MFGTKLLQAAQAFGIDLRVRYVAWEDAMGVVHVAHSDIRVLAERHVATGVDETSRWPPACSPTRQLAAGGSAAFSRRATGPSRHDRGPPEGGAL